MSRSQINGLVVAVGFSCLAVLGVVLLLIFTAQREATITGRNLAERKERKLQPSAPLAPATQSAKLASPAGASVIRVDAWSLYRDYLRQPIQANAEYLRKTLEVTGTVKGVVLGERGLIQVYLEVDASVDSRPHEGGVRCEFPTDALPKIAKLSVGNRVTIRGTGGGLAAAETVLLRDCTECELVK